MECVSGGEAHLKFNEMTRGKNDCGKWSENKKKESEMDELFDWMLLCSEKNVWRQETKQKLAFYAQQVKRSSFHDIRQKKSKRDLNRINATLFYKGRNEEKLNKKTTEKKRK